MGRESTFVVDEQDGLVLVAVSVDGAEMVQSAGPPAISRPLLSMPPVMVISCLNPGQLARSRAGLHTFKCVVRLGGKAHHNAIPRHDPAAGYHDAHDPRLADDIAVAIVSKNGVQRTEEHTSELQSRQYL